MGTMLGKIKEFVDNLSRVISDVVDTDVIIADSNMNVVGSAFRYFSLYQDIEYGSLIATILVNNENLIIEDKASIQSCRECKKYKECKMKGFVGVPIYYGNQVLGVIALILPRFKVKSLFENIDSTIMFMESMAGLITIRMKDHMEKKGLKQKIREIEQILDLMDDAVLYTDRYGNIMYQNQVFCDIFASSGIDLGSNLTKVYPEFEAWYRGGEENEKNLLNHDQWNFYGVVSSKKVWLNESEGGMILRFRSYRNIHDTSKLFSLGTMVTFQWLRQFYREDILEKAK